MGTGNDYWPAFSCSKAVAMRILLLHQHFSVETGSVASRTVILAKRLKSYKRSVTVLLGNCEFADSGLFSKFVWGVRWGCFDGLNIIEIDIPYANSFGFVARICSFVEYAVAAFVFAVCRRWDFVIATSTPLAVAIPMIAAKVLRGCKCVFEVRDPWPDFPLALGKISQRSAWLFELIEKLAVKAGSSICCLAPGVLVKYRRWGASLQKLGLIPNFCEYSISGMGSIDQGVRNQRPNGFCIGYFGSHGEANGLFFLVEVAKECWRSNRQICFFVVGDGMKKSHLLKDVEVATIGNMYFLDPVPRSRLSALMSRLDIAFHCLVPNDAFDEGISPNKIFEALRFGIPIVTNCRSWISQVLIEACAGIVVCATDARVCARVLLRLATDSGRTAEMARAAVKVGLGQFSSRDMGNRLHGIVERVSRVSSTT